MAQTLFSLFLIQCQKAERELFEKLCRTYPDLDADLELLYRSWSRRGSTREQDQQPPRDPAT